MVSRRTGAGRGSLVARGILIVSLLGLTVALGGPAAEAHVPHDVVTSVAPSPQFASDQTVFALVRGHLLRSGNGASTWTEIVRGIGIEILEQVAIAPTDKTRMYLASDAGVYRSTDAGLSWTLTPVPGGVTHIAVSPANPAVVLAGGRVSGLRRTSNGGQTWVGVAGSFGTVTALSFQPGGGGAVLGTQTGQIFTSVDAGATWTTTFTNPSGKAITALGTRPNAPANLTLAGTSAGELFRSTNAGSSFGAFGTGIPQEQIMSIAISSTYATDHTVWMSTYTTGVYRSTNSGGAWTRTAAGLTTDAQANQYGFPQFGTVVMTPGQSHAVLFEGGFDGFFRSDNLGATWQERQTLTEYITGLAVSPDYAHDHSVVVTTYIKGAYLTADAGASWQSIDNGLGRPLGDNNKFAPVDRLFGTAFSPDYANDGTIFAANWEHVLKSTDRGQSWTQLAVPVAPGELSFARLFVFAVSPSFATDQTLFVGTKTGAVFRSTDGGTSWTLLNELGSRVRTVAISPTYPTDHTVYISAVSGIFRSTDQGGTWTKTSPSGVTTPQLAISPNYANDGTVVAATPRGLWVTRDAGQSWSVSAAAPLSATSPVDAVAISPTYATDQTILVSVRTLGLFRSTDGGNTFTAVGTALLAANHSVVDFENPASSPIQYSPTYATDHTVYAFGGMDLMRSTNSGVTWSIVALPKGADLVKPPTIAAFPTTARVLEGSPDTTVVLNVPFVLSHPYAQTVTVQWQTTDGTTEPDASSATGDFVAASGVLVFPQGSTEQFAAVTVNGDSTPEPDENVVISMSNPTNATLAGNGTGFGVITNDD